MKLIFKIIALGCFAVAAFSSLINVNLPIQFGWAGLFFWFLADLIR